MLYAVLALLYALKVKDGIPIKMCAIFNPVFYFPMPKPIILTVRSHRISGFLLSEFRMKRNILQLKLLTRTQNKAK